MRRMLVVCALLVLLPILTSCESGELQQLIYWAKLWAIVHDVTDEDGNPNFGAATRFTAGEAFGLGTTGDEEGDAAIDAARVVDKMRRAEDAADKGQEALYGGSNVKESVLPHFDTAIGLRPGDWSYRNERGIAILESRFPSLDIKVARADFDKAAVLARQNKRSDEYLRMLKHREQVMAKLVGQRYAERADVNNEIYQEQVRTYDELYKMTNDRSYLLLKQQADTNQQTKGWRTVPDGSK